MFKSSAPNASSSMASSPPWFSLASSLNKQEKSQELLYCHIPQKEAIIYILSVTAYKAYLQGTTTLLKLIQRRTSENMTKRQAALQIKKKTARISQFTVKKERKNLEGIECKLTRWPISSY
jgi:hypothetical protein